MIFITQGRFTRDAMNGMIAKPEDRAVAVGKLAKGAGGKLLSYYMTMGEYDFMCVIEGGDEKQMLPALIVAGATGGVTDLKTTVALTSKEGMAAFAAAKETVGRFQAAGTK